mmetsp:Transcript_18953/g.33667  ORF Transcript_18953/g.33667 Transcript_18953/m.33667 type:complete len:203 (-) Transcript_18953:2700-3308(-)
MVHTVLRNVGSAEVVVLPHLTSVPVLLIELKLSNKQLQQRGFTSSVGTLKCHAAVQTETSSDILKDHLVCSRVRIGHIANFGYRATTVCNTGELASLRELHRLDIGNHGSGLLVTCRRACQQLKGIVSTRVVSSVHSVFLRETIHNVGALSLELGETIRVVSQLEVCNVNNVRSDEFHKLIVMRNKDNGRLRESSQVVLEPV